MGKLMLIELTREEIVTICTALGYANWSYNVLFQGHRERCFQPNSSKSKLELVDRLLYPKEV